MNRYNVMRIEKGKVPGHLLFDIGECPGTVLKLWLLYQDMKWNTTGKKIFLITSKEEVTLHGLAD